MPIPAFRPDGYLPVGIHVATDAEVRECFGQANPERIKLFLLLEGVLQMVKGIGCPRFFINGSFVADKEAILGQPPGDIDCVAQLPENWLELEQQNDPRWVFLDQIARMPRPKPIDLFLAVDRNRWDFWARWFQHIRYTTERKGIVEIHL